MAGAPYSKADQCGPKRVKAATKQARKWTGGQVVRARVAARSGGLCEIGLEGVCKVKAECFHHRKRRSQGGPDTYENLLHLCDKGGCHEWVHANVAESLLRGWLLRSTDEPSGRPLGAYPEENR